MSRVGCRAHTDDPFAPMALLVAARARGCKPATVNVQAVRVRNDDRARDALRMSVPVPTHKRVISWTVGQLGGEISTAGTG